MFNSHIFTLIFTLEGNSLLSDKAKDNLPWFVPVSEILMGPDFVLAALLQPLGPLGPLGSGHENLGWSTMSCRG